MIPKSGYRFSEKIMLKQQAKAKQRIDLKSFRFGVRDDAVASRSVQKKTLAASGELS
jgi:hypothetical protein